MYAIHVDAVTIKTFKITCYDTCKDSKNTWSFFQNCLHCKALIKMFKNVETAFLCPSRCQPVASSKTFDFLSVSLYFATCRHTKELKVCLLLLLTDKEHMGHVVETRQSYPLDEGHICRQIHQSNCSGSALWGPFTQTAQPQ